MSRGEPGEVPETENQEGPPRVAAWFGDVKQTWLAAYDFPGVVAMTKIDRLFMLFIVALLILASVVVFWMAIASI